MLLIVVFQMLRYIPPNFIPENLSGICLRHGSRFVTIPEKFSGIMLAHDRLLLSLNYIGINIISELCLSWPGVALSTENFHGRHLPFSPQLVSCAPSNRQYFPTFGLWVPYWETKLRSASKNGVNISNLLKDA